MLHIFYKRFPYGTKEAFAEDELFSLAKKYDKIRIYCYGDNTAIKRSIPENCELVNLFEAKKAKLNKIKAFFRMLSFRTVKEIFYMRKCGYKVCPKNLHRIFMYYFYYGFSSEYSFEVVNGDTVYSYWLGDVSYPVSRLKKKNREIRFVSRAHGFDMYAERGYNPFRREIISQLDHLYCINSSGRDDILSHYGEYITEDKVSVAHLGVPCPETLTVREFGGNDNVIVTVSNIIPLKRLDMLIGALSTLDCKVTWYHFGSGTIEKEIKRLAEEKLSPKANIRYEFKGQTDHNEVLRFLREEKVDLFVNCSDYEGIPVSVMEAMAYGIPAVARNVGGMSELVNNENGFLLDKETDVTKLRNAIESFIELSSDEKSFKSKKAYETIFSEFDSKKNYEEFGKTLIYLS